MKRLTRFYDNDLRELVAEKCGVTADKVTSVFTEEVVGYGLGEHTEPVFYVEVEEDG